MILISVIRKKIRISFLVVFLFSCSYNKPELVDLDRIEFDVTKRYPEKKLEIYDLANVNYVILQTEEEYVYQYPLLTLTENFIIATNLNSQEFLFFDRTGQPISKVYRRGEGPEEYSRADNFLYVEEENHLYIVDWYNHKIKVYNKEGVFKKEYTTPEEKSIEGIYNYNEDTLLLFFMNQQYPFGLLSKADGNVVYLEDIFIEKPKMLMVEFNNVRMPDGRVGSGNTHIRGHYALKNDHDFLLTAYTLDTTIYRLTPDKEISPVLIRKPSFEETDPKIALHSFIETPNYLFFSSVLMEHDKETFYFPNTGYVIDKNNRHIYKQHITNRDFEGKELMIDASSVNTFLSPNAGVLSYHIDELVDADEKNQLKGQLKETFDRMDPEDEYLFLIYQLK